MLLRHASWYRRWLGRRATQSDEDHNTRYLYLEILFVCVTTTVISFHGVFAVRLGASDQLVGLLSSLPPLIVAITTIPAGIWLERQARLRPVLLVSVFLYRLGFLLIALMPFIVQQGQAVALVFIVMLMTVPMTVLGVTFNTIFAEIVPERRRAEVVSWRFIILGAGVTLVGFASGRALDAVAFPINFQAFYFIAFVTATFGTVLLFWLRIPETRQRPTTAGEPRRLGLASTRALLADSPGFARIIVNTLIYGIGVWMVTPLYSIFFVRALGADNTWMGLLTGIINFTTMLGYFLAQRWVRRWGDRPVLAWGMTLAGVYPILVGLSPGLTPILVFGAFSGIAMSCLNLSHFNTLLKVIPADRRPSGFALYTLMMNLGAFISPLISVALADRIGIRPAIVLAGVFWVAGGLLFVIRPPEPARPPAPVAAPSR
jgi:MFS family permease